MSHSLFSPVSWASECRLGTAVIASLAVHAVAMSVSLPAPRVLLFEPPPLRVSLREFAAPPVVAPAPESVAPTAPLPAKRMQPERRRHEPLPLARRSEPPATSPASSVEEERVLAAVPETSPSPTPPAEPAPSPLAAQVPAPRASFSDLLAGYGQTISLVLARYTDYPRVAQMQGWQGAVTMRLRVAPSGRLLDAEVQTSSGHEVLDRQALAMAARAERFPAPPEGLRDREVAVLVPVVFRLER
jgi:protein TonB